MQIITNTVAPENVERREWNGREYLVAQDVVAAQAMRLNKGYVPTAEIEKSASAWWGTPTTANHPVGPSGEPTSANRPGVAENTWTGHFFDARAENGGEQLVGDVWVDIERTRNLGDVGEQIVNRLEAGDPLEVSTSYFFDRLEPGRYDGEHRDRVVGNLRPDHLALLPDSEGRCSLDDGCGFRPVANAGDPAVGDGVGGPTPQLMATETSDDMTDDTAARRAYNALSALFGDGAADTPTDEQPSDEPADTGMDATDDDTDTEPQPMNDDDKIDTLVDNHGLDRENMESLAGTDCLDDIYARFAGNEDEDTTDDEQAGSDADTDDSDGTDTTTTATSPDEPLGESDVRAIVADEVGDTVSEALAENETEAQRAELVEEITANSDAYDADALSETPVATLKDIAANLDTSSTAANYAGRGGAGAARIETDDAGDWPAPSANERSQELAANEGDD